jgi:caspase domain-containing protein
MIASLLRVVASALLLGCSAFPAHAEKRVALVIGNSTYQNASKLPNPARDAQAIADLLAGAGFDVVQSRSDLGNLEFKRAVREFTEVARGADIAVMFYAGHGIEVGGTNYLVPVDALLAKDYDAEDEAVPLDRLVRALEPARRLRLIILDACRDNPFVKRMQRTVAMRAMSTGLAKVEPATPNTLIAFAARAGSTADDGDGLNSPFTAALLKHIAQPGVDIQMALRRVRDEVLRSTGNRQEPFHYGSLGGAEIPLVPPPPEPAKPTAADMRRDYELAERVGTRDAWETFLRAYPTGYYADLARLQLGKADHEARLHRDTAEREERARIERERAQGAERERPAREQAERERREAARREDAARTQERERLAREGQQGAPADAPANLQTAMLTPPSEPAAPPKPRTLSGGPLVQAIKTELKRVGCYGGRIDDKWSGETKTSVKKFVKHANLSSAPDQPALDFLDAVRAKPERVCPLECAAREVEAHGRCVAKTCPDGQRLRPDGQCAAVEKSSPRSKQAEKPRKSGRRCFVMGGQSYCE